MVNYREILRHTSLGYSQRQIAASVHSSRSTISEVHGRKKEAFASEREKWKWKNSVLEALVRHLQFVVLD